MPERAALIGGKLAVWSEVGAGTEVELRLPASIVYATSREALLVVTAVGLQDAGTTSRRRVMSAAARRFGFSRSTTIHSCAKGSPVSWEFSRI